MPPLITVKRTYLQIGARSELTGARIDDDPLLRLARIPAPTVELAQQLYRDVGAAYHWADRWKWPAEEWKAWVERPGFGTWILSHDGNEAGFFDLHWDESGSCEVELFGLVHAYHGRGFGKHLLTCAADVAFTVGTSRLWLHTCTLDDPHALPNYLARGFKPFREETYTTEA